MIPEKELRQMYCDDKMTMTNIAELIGVSASTVCQWMKLHNIESRVNKTKLFKADIIKMYLDEKMTVVDISEVFNVSTTTVRHWLKVYVITKKPSKENLDEMYNGMNMTQLEIANKIGVSQPGVLKWMREYGIESRARSEPGENSINWKGGISFEPYCKRFNNTFKEAIRERDNYMCQLCGSGQNGRRLDVHHIHYDKENCYPDVVTLCCSCNSMVNSDRNYWEDFFEDQLNQRGMLNWNISN